MMWRRLRGRRPRDGHVGQLLRREAAWTTVQAAAVDDVSGSAAGDVASVDEAVRTAVGGHLGRVGASGGRSPQIRQQTGLRDVASVDEAAWTILRDVAVDEAAGGGRGSRNRRRGRGLGAASGGMSPAWARPRRRPRGMLCYG